MNKLSSAQKLALHWLAYQTKQLAPEALAKHPGWYVNPDAHEYAQYDIPVTPRTILSLISRGLVKINPDSESDGVYYLSGEGLDVAESGDCDLAAYTEAYKAYHAAIAVKEEARQRNDKAFYDLQHREQLPVLRLGQFVKVWRNWGDYITVQIALVVGTTDNEHVYKLRTVNGIISENANVLTAIDELVAFVGSLENDPGLFINNDPIAFWNNYGNPTHLLTIDPSPETLPYLHLFIAHLAKTETVTRVQEINY